MPNPNPEATPPLPQRPAVDELGWPQTGNVVPTDADCGAIQRQFGNRDGRQHVIPPDRVQPAITAFVRSFAPE